VPEEVKRGGGNGEGEERGERRRGGKEVERRESGGDLRNPLYSCIDFVSPLCHVASTNEVFAYCRAS
jgi:hypothetical protein